MKWLNDSFKISLGRKDSALHSYIHPCFLLRDDHHERLL
jgi:hypothetical protein